MSFFDLAAPLSLPTKLAIAAVVAAGIATAGYVKGYAHGTEKLVEFKTQVAAASAKAEAENTAKLDAATDNTREVARLYAADTARVRHLYRSRLDGLRNELRDCQTVPAAPGPATGLDAGTAHQRPAAGKYEAACVKLEQDCAATTLQTVHLQRYILGLCKAYGCEK